ncbi:methyltransferase domain-containing protein [Kribbella sp. WER1]
MLPDVSGKDVIDLGCGTAYIGAWVLRAGGRSVGIDNSAEQLATARTLQDKTGLRFPLINGNAESVPLPDDSFDVAISEYGASSWCDPALWIPEAARLLRPGGRLIFLRNSTLVELCTPPDAPAATGRLSCPYADVVRIARSDGGTQPTGRPWSCGRRPGRRAPESHRASKTDRSICYRRGCYVERMGKRMSEARMRLLSTATGLFYSEGIHAVGVDRVIAEAQVTRATLYRHFPSKDDLTVAYLTAADDAMRARVADARTTDASPDDVIRAVATSITDDITGPGFRGCAFLNAAAEYPDPAHPVHQAVLKHRDWFLATMTELFTATGKPDPEPAARHFVMLRDGAMTAGCLTDPAPICDTFTRGVDGLLTYRSRLG